MKKHVNRDNSIWFKHPPSLPWSQEFTGKTLFIFATLAAVCWYSSRGDDSNIHQPTCLNAMVEDALVPNRHRAISNHHAHLNMLQCHMDHIMQHIYISSPIPAGISNHMPNKVWNEITYPILYSGWNYLSMYAGPWFNKKISSYQYRKSYCGDKTILRPSYLHNGISYTGKTTSLHWVRALVIWCLRLPRFESYIPAEEGNLSPFDSKSLPWARKLSKSNNKDEISSPCQSLPNVLTQSFWNIPSFLKAQLLGFWWRPPWMADHTMSCWCLAANSSCLQTDPGSPQSQ